MCFESAAKKSKSALVKVNFLHQCKKMMCTTTTTQTCYATTLEACCDLLFRVLSQISKGKKIFCCHDIIFLCREVSNTLQILCHGPMKFFENYKTFCACDITILCSEISGTPLPLFTNIVSTKNLVRNITTFMFFWVFSHLPSLQNPSGTQKEYYGTLLILFSFICLHLDEILEVDFIPHYVNPSVLKFMLCISSSIKELIVDFHAQLVCYLQGRNNMQIKFCLCCQCSWLQHFIQKL